MDTVLICAILSFMPAFQSGFVAGQTADNVKSIISTIYSTNGYDKNIRPSQNQSLITSVSVSLNLLAINDVNEVAETFKTSGYLTIQWKDEFFAWNPVSYDGIQFVLYPQSKVWVPDISLKNSFNDYKQLGAPELKVVITHTGTVTWTPIQVRLLFCFLYVHPFRRIHFGLCVIYSALKFSAIWTKHRLLYLLRNVD